MILLDSYHELIDHRFNIGVKDTLPSSVVGMIVQDVPLFFKTHGNNGRRYIVVSYHTDYGVEYQAENHPNADLARVIYHYKWPEITAQRQGYVKLVVGPACDQNTCNVNDKYSVKIYSSTHSTFNEIPSNIVRWYSINLNIEDERSRWIPLGMNEDVAPLIDKYTNRPKTKLCYANFRNHTYDRLVLNNFLSQQPWCNCVADASIPIEKYLEDMAEHKFVIAPPGVGHDCYRTYEAIKLGCVPILQESRFSRYLLDQHLPVLLVEDFRMVNENALNYCYDQMVNQLYDLSCLDINYWKFHVNEDRKLL